jgi:hypothetical protein
MTLLPEEYHELQTGENWNKKFQSRMQKEEKDMQAYRAIIPDYNEKLKQGERESIERLRAKGLNILDDGTIIPLAKS